MRRFAGWIVVLLLACALSPGSSALARDINAPLIANDAQAKQMCPQICKTSGGTWNGKWSTPQGRATSVCGCKMPPPPEEPARKNLNAGPIANDRQAEQMCPSVCKSENRVWKGQWKATGGGRGAVCTCLLK